jgi:hypothetical protein
LAWTFASLAWTFASFACTLASLASALDKHIGFITLSSLVDESAIEAELGLYVIDDMIVHLGLLPIWRVYLNQFSTFLMFLRYVKYFLHR